MADSRITNPWPATMVRLLAVTFSLFPLVLSTGCGSSDKNKNESDTQVQTFSPAEFDTTYAAYANVLATYVRGDRVDYARLKQHRADLDLFVQQLAGLTAAQYEAMSRDRQMAFWINAYNALTLRSVIDYYPVMSIRDIDGVWDKTTWPVAGRDVTIDAIENEILRPQFGDPRLHFAINCASVGCPPLRSEPYRGDKLDEQLDSQVRRFVNLPTRTEIDTASHTITTTEIFSWFGDDFRGQYAPGNGTIAGLTGSEAAAFNFVLAHLDDATAMTIDTEATWTIEYFEYDWNLNDLPD